MISFTMQKLAILVCLLLFFSYLPIVHTEESKMDWSYLTLRPTGQGTYTAWIDEPDVGSNHFQNVNEIVADDDTTRLKSNVFLAGDSWAMENTVQTEPISSVTQWVRAKADAERSLDIGFNTGGIYYYSIYPVTSTYTNYSIVWLECPWTSAEWTWNDVNDIEFYISRLGGGEYIYVTQAYITVKYGTPPAIPPVPPTLSDETPSGGTIGIPINLPRVSALINDTDGDNFNWTIGGGPNILTNSSTGDWDGIKYADTIAPLPYNTLITWWINASDDDGYVNESYVFRTEIAPTGADIVYVDDGYDSGTPGWDYDHFNNIQDGVSAVSTGGNVIVYAGTYTESIHIDKSLSLTGTSATIVDGAGANTVFYIDANDVSLDTLTIQHGRPCGIILDHADSFSVYDCQFIDNYVLTSDFTGGIYFIASSYALITDNSFTDSDVRIINDRNCNYNRIYHNNFFNSQGIDDPPGVTPDPITNRWNDTYPSGGNYFELWISLFTDVYSGPNQDIPGSDGISDNFVFCGRSNKDYYPFMKPLVLGVAHCMGADFFWEPYYPNVNETVSFYESVCSQNVISWKWKLGDGTTRASAKTTHIYKQSGYYDVTLTIIDKWGAVDHATKQIFIGGVHNPPIEDPKYPGYTVPEMYQLLKADKLPATNNNVKIMVIDTGVIQRTYNGIDLKKITVEYNRAYSSGIDENGHGTWCSYAVAYLLQTKAPKAVQISYRMLDKGGGCNTQIFLDALDQAMRDGVDVVSVSAGSDFGKPNDPFAKKCDELRRAGIIVIVAAGNKGPASSTIASPGVSDSAIAVGADDPQWYGETMTPARLNGILNLNDDKIAYWSSRGPVSGVSYYKPDVVAPGESIIGPWLDREKIVSGTSMATPLVAGGVALIVANNRGLIDQAKQALFWDKSAISNAMEDALKESCYVKGDKNTWGAGIVQFDKANTIFQQKLSASIINGYAVLIILLIILLLILYALYRAYKKKKTKKWWAK